MSRTDAFLAIFEYTNRHNSSPFTGTITITKQLTHKCCETVKTIRKTICNNTIHGNETFLLFQNASWTYRIPAARLNYLRSGQLWFFFLCKQLSLVCCKWLKKINWLLNHLCFHLLGKPMTTMEWLLLNGNKKSACKMIHFAALMLAWLFLFAISHDNDNDNEIFQAPSNLSY